MSDLSNIPPAAAPGASADTPTTSPVVMPPVVDVQSQINQALQAQQAEFAEQLKAATGHSDIKALTDEQLKHQGKLQELVDSKTAEANGYRAKFEQTQIANALLYASQDAVDSVVISELLAGKAVVDEKGTVTIGGKTASEAVKQLLSDKPFLAKAQGGPGSGTPSQVTTANGEKNPWSKNHFNLTEQSRIYQQDPALAATLKAQATA